jgi:RHS repeat-associated protein
VSLGREALWGARVVGGKPQDATYDELGRVKTRTLNSVTTTWSYDALGRLSSLVDPIGTFSYAYVGTTGRVSSVTYPNSQTSTYAYLGNSGDNRLQEIHHKKPDASTLSKFTYTYDAVGNIKTWTQQSDSDAAKAYDFGYDPADQLTSAVYRTTDPTPTILKRYGYAYDPAGNRTTEQIDDAATAASYDSMNRLTSQAPGGALLFKGTTSETATVTVGGKPATTTSSNTFSGPVPVPSGTSNVEVKATDPSGNVRTNTYQVTQSGSSTSFAYDDNGNLIGQGTKTYEFDAEDRLLRVLDGGNEVARFVYDGLGRRQQKVAGGVTRTYVYGAATRTRSERWALLEERPSSGYTRRNVQGPGIDEPLAMVENAVVSYYVADHLGSVVRVTDSSGTSTLTRQYDPWGNLLAGSTTGGVAYTGREWDNETGLYYYRARYYSAQNAGFTSEDPARARAIAGVYAYVSNNPIGRIDPLGLDGIAAVGGAKNKLCDLLLKSPPCAAAIHRHGLLPCYQDLCWKKPPVFQCVKQDVLGPDTCAQTPPMGPILIDVGATRANRPKLCGAPSLVSLVAHELSHLCSATGRGPSRDCDGPSCPEDVKAETRARTSDIENNCSGL